MTILDTFSCPRSLNSSLSKAGAWVIYIGRAVLGKAGSYLGLLRLSRSPTPRALYHSSAYYACYLPFPSRELLAPPAFPNTARPISLKRLLRLLSLLSLARAPRASRVPQHRAPYITQAPTGRKNRWLAERYDVKRVAALLMRLRKSFSSFKFFKMAEGHRLYLQGLGKWFGSYGRSKSPWIVSLRGVWIGR